MWYDNNEGVLKMTPEEAKERLKDFTYAKCKEYCYDRGEDCFDCYIELEQVVAIETIMKELDILNKQIEHMSIDISEVWNQEDMDTTPEKIREFFRYKAEGKTRGKING